MISAWCIGLRHFCYPHPPPAISQWHSFPGYHSLIDWQVFTFKYMVPRVNVRRTPRGEMSACRAPAVLLTVLIDVQLTWNMYRAYTGEWVTGSTAGQRVNRRDAHRSDQISARDELFETVLSRFVRLIPIRFACLGWVVWLCMDSTKRFGYEYNIILFYFMIDFNMFLRQ